MNKSFRLALLKNWRLDTPETVIDLTSYEKTAQEPESGSTRNWSLMGYINQKQTRKQDSPVNISNLPEEMKLMVQKKYPDLIRKSDFKK